MTTGRGDFFFNFERRNQSHNERHITHSIQEARSVSNQFKYIHTLKYSTVSPNDIISSTFISKRAIPVLSLDNNEMERNDSGIERKAMEIIDKYHNNKGEFLLPVISNQRMNKYLKELKVYNYDFF